MGDSLREMTQGKPLFSPGKSHETRMIPARKENLMDPWEHDMGYEVIEPRNPITFLESWDIVFIIK